MVELVGGSASNPARAPSSRSNRSRKELPAMTVPEREDFMFRVFQESRDYLKNNYEEEFVENFRLFRALKDTTSPYENKDAHPLTFAIVTGLHAALFPVFLSSNPMFQIDDPNPDNRDRNNQTEKIVHAQITNPAFSNFRAVYDRALTDFLVFGITSIWTSFRREHKLVGPIHTPVLAPNGSPILDKNGVPLTEEGAQRVMTYNGPWVDYIQPFDNYLHPDGKMGLVRRPTTGHELLRSSMGPGARYDERKVDRLLKNEVMQSEKARSADGGGFGVNTAEDEEERLQRELGIEGERYHQRLYEANLDTVLGRNFRIMHYDDGEFLGSYAVNDSQQFMELRWTPFTPDGLGQRTTFRMHPSPGENVYGPGLIGINKGVLKQHSRFWQMFQDGAALTGHPMWAISSALKNHNGELVVGPGYTVEVPVGPMGGKIQDHIQRLDMPQSWMNSVSVVDVLERSANEGMASAPFTRGQFGGGRRTAREISTISDMAGTRVEMYHERLKLQLALPMIRKFMALNAVHYRPRDYVKFLGEAEAFAYQPPTVREIVEDMSYTPKGSLAASDVAMRRAQWPTLIQGLIQTAPFLNIPYIREMVRNWIEDFGIPVSSTMMPDANSPEMSEHQMNVLIAQQIMGGGQGGAGQGSPPRTPGGPGAVDAGQGGAEAPPGPPNGGVISAAGQAGNGSPNRFGGL